MSNNQERISMQQGTPQFEEVRDHVPFRANLGMIDRWLMGREGKKTQNVVKTTQITSSNHQKIKVGEKVTLSAPLWRTFTILSALVDTNTRAIKRGFKKQIAEDYLAMTPRAFQQHLNVLYEIGLLDFYEKEYKGDMVTDIFIFPYPKYADTQACYLKRFRDVAERDGIGVQKSRRATQARIEKMILAEQEEVEKKSSQPKKSDLEKKNSQVLEKKSSQGVEKKSSQGVEKKSSHTKVIMSQSNYHQSNNNQSFNIEDIQNSDLPTAVKVCIKGLIERLNDNHITLLQISDIYKSYTDVEQVTDNLFVKEFRKAVEKNEVITDIDALVTTYMTNAIAKRTPKTPVNKQSTRVEVMSDEMKQHQEESDKKAAQKPKSVLQDDYKPKITMENIVGIYNDPAQRELLTDEEKQIALMLIEEQKVGVTQ